MMLSHRLLAINNGELKLCKFLMTLIYQAINDETFPYLESVHAFFVKLDT
jgi:hypothetical protein